MRPLLLILFACSLLMDVGPAAVIDDNATANLSEGIIYWFTGCTIDYDHDVEWCVA